MGHYYHSFHLFTTTYYTLSSKLKLLKFKLHEIDEGFSPLEGRSFWLPRIRNLFVQQLMKIGRGGGGGEGTPMHRLYTGMCHGICF